MSALPSIDLPKLHAVHTLLRARKLDRTLTSEIPAKEEAAAAFALDAITETLGGGIPRGHMSDIHGPVSSGRTSLAWGALAAATARGEWVALVDTFDRFDPVEAADAGMILSRLLWVRGQAVSKTSGALDPAWIPGERAVRGRGTLLERTIDRAIKALNVVAQSGVCTLIVLDLIDVPAAALTRVPRSTWLRLQRVVEGTETALLLLAAVPVARSAGGLSIATGAATTSGVGSALATGAGRRETEMGRAITPSADRVWQEDADPRPFDGAQGRPELIDGRRPTPDSRQVQVRWKGGHDRSRRLGGVSTRLRANSPRGYVGELPLALG
jgi:hypothetical protein